MTTENRQLSTWLPPATAQAVVEAAKKEKRSVSSWIAFAVEEKLAANGMAVPPAGEA